MQNRKSRRALSVVFPTGQSFPINYYQTSDTYRAELPAGVYEAELLPELSGILKQEFDGVRMVWTAL